MVKHTQTIRRQLALKGLIHKESADELDLIDIANMFREKKSRKKTRFWYFL